REGGGLWGLIDDHAEASGVTAPGEGAEQDGEAGMGGERVAVAFRLRLKLERADVEAVQINLIKGADIGGPAVGGSGPEEARKGQQPPPQNAPHAPGNARKPQRHSAASSPPPHAPPKLPRNRGYLVLRQLCVPASVPWKRKEFAPGWPAMGLRGDGLDATPASYRTARERREARGDPRRPAIRSFP